LARVLLCTIDDIEDSSAQGFDPKLTDADSLFVVRKNGRFFGYKNSCPHIEGTSLNWRKDAFLTHDKQHIKCFGHGALFDIESGEGVEGACLGQALTPVDLTVEDGQIYLVEDLGKERPKKLQPLRNVKK